MICGEMLPLLFSSSFPSCALMQELAAVRAQGGSQAQELASQLEACKAEAARVKAALEAEAARVKAALEAELGSTRADAAAKASRFEHGCRLPFCSRAQPLVF